MCVDDHHHYHHHQCFFLTDPPLETPKNPDDKDEQINKIEEVNNYEGKNDNDVSFGGGQSYYFRVHSYSFNFFSNFYIFILFIISPLFFSSVLLKTLTIKISMSSSLGSAWANILSTLSPEI